MLVKLDHETPRGFGPKLPKTLDIQVAHCADILTPKKYTPDIKPHGGIHLDVLECTRGK